MRSIDTDLPTDLPVDPVTGLHLRHAFEQGLADLLTADDGHPRHDVALILLDLDRFAAVTGGLGSQGGDRLIAEVARRLVGELPAGSLAARVGGDEFAVVPPPTDDPDDVRRLAVRLAEALRAPYVVPETGSMLVSPATLGVSHAGGRRLVPADLLREADEALHQAREQAHDRFLVFEGDPAQVRRSAERRIREALDHRRLRLLFQPVVDFSGGRTAGAEALLRIDEGDRRVPPGLWLDVAERTGLVIELDAWVVEQAVMQLSRWRDSWLSVNLSARTLADPRVPRRLLEAVKRGELPRDRLYVELAEESLAGVPPTTEAVLRNLVASGIRVGVDHYTAGHVPLEVLEQFGIDFVKLDRAIEGSSVQSMIDMAHSRDVRVIAQGVESPREARRLREYGCDFAQGFHFGRPGEAARIVQG